MNEMAMNQNPVTKSKDVCLVALIEFIFSLSCVRNIYKYFPNENIPIMKFISYFMRKFRTNNIRQIIGYTHRTSRVPMRSCAC